MPPHSATEGAASAATSIEAPDAAAPLPHVGLLGCGLMGSKMAQRLLTQGFAVTVWNRSSAKAERLQSVRASFAAVPQLCALRAMTALLSGLVVAHLGQRHAPPAVPPEVAGVGDLRCHTALIPKKQPCKSSDIWGVGQPT